MPWLRLDDGFPEHRKMLALDRNDRWTWLEILCFCARNSGGTHAGTVPANIGEVLRYATPRFLRKCVEIGLLDEHAEGLKVHDWAEYNPKDPTNAVRQQRYRERHRNGQVTDETVTDTVTGDVTNVTPRATRVPVPYPLTTASNEAAASANAAAAEPPTDEPDDDERQQLDALKAAGWTRAQLARLDDREQLDRAHGLLVEARADASVRRPGALAWQRFEQGAHAGSGAAAPSVAVGAQGERSRSARLLPFGPCAVDGCDHRAATAEALDEHRRNVHGEGEGERVGPPAQLLALLGARGPAGEPETFHDDDVAEVAG